MHGARNGEKAKNGTASNRDNLPAGGFNLAPAVLGRIETRRLSAALFLNTAPLRYGNSARFTSQTVLAITVGIVCLGETSIHRRKANQSTLTGREKNREFGVMLATLHRVGPLAGLTFALVATVGWMALLGYVAIKLF